MNIAIVGAGLCGVALAWHLSSTGTCKVCLFDGKGIAGGTSGIATGLMHPYAGEQVRRSRKAQEGLAATLRLIDAAEAVLKRAVADRSGILRLTLNPEQVLAFDRHAADYGDVERLSDNRFLIRSGVTVDVPLYLQGLWQAAKNLGAVFYPVMIDSLEQLRDYDRIIVAAGAGVHKFKECGGLPLKMIKGQILTCVRHEGFPYERSVTAKGYISPCGDSRFFHFGATYERQFESEEPCLRLALEQLQPKLKAFFPDGPPLSVVDVRAGIRVSSIHGYFPIARRVADKIWALTAMGSRGLLYHAYMAESLTQAILNGDCNVDVSASRANTNVKS
jgi:glycine/D-amino acid oxidase-like deaminating enzyme